MKGPKCKRFEKKVDANVKWKPLQNWSERMIDQVFERAEPGEEIELKITVDFKNAPKYETPQQKQELIQKIVQIEANYIPKSVY
ncbi:hypothetical protein TELCIR_06090 [Teladorsagia circumcincta]|uniref:Uncharacterized protein n=1 Tax=Teladorsagia circumcincta TaxID=45464 RepID=A0A2G9UPC1_TELCI|nr:hypothetical protein TELCIR_06090 [Teladorsagia circumcincta]